jgi:hypothetical protein
VHPLGEEQAGRCQSHADATGSAAWPIRRKQIIRSMMHLRDAALAAYGVDANDGDLVRRRDTVDFARYRSHTGSDLKWPKQGSVLPMAATSFT